MQISIRSTITAPILALAALCFAVEPTAAVPLLNDDGRTLIETASGTADTPQAHEYRSGIQDQLKGDLAGAKARYDAALKIDPRYAPALIGLAAVAQAQGNAQQAKEYLQQAENAAPQFAAVQLAWGRYFLGSRKMDRAETAFLKARELAPSAIPPLLELGEFYLRTPGRNADALKAFRHAVALDGRNKFAQYGLGAAAAAIGHRKEALNAFDKAAELAPQDPAPLRAAGRLHMEAGAFDKALAAFDRGLARQPKYMPLMLDRADALAMQKRWDDAVAQAEAAEKLAPRSSEAQLKLADIYQGAGRSRESEARYLKAIELDPRNAMAYNNLAWLTVSRKGDANKAAEWARKAVKISPGSSPFYDTLGWALQAAGDTHGALDSLRQAIKLEPNVAVYHFHLGVVQGKLKQAAAARASLQRALELDGKLPQADEARRFLKALPSG